MTDEMMHEALQAAISLYGGNTALGRLVRERGAVGVFEIAFEYGWRSLKPKAQEGKDADAPATGFLSSVETMDEAKAQVLPDMAGGIRVEWQKGNPVFIGFGDAHAINTLIASIRDQKMDVEKAALNSDCVTDGGVMRLLSSIENRLIELADGPGIGRLAGWLERIDKDIYHVTTRQESIDIEQRRMISEILDLLRPKDEETSCPEPMTCGVDLATGPDVTAVHMYDTETRKSTPIEDISDEMLDQIKEQLPVSVYVAEVERRQKARAYTGEASSVDVGQLTEQLRTARTLEAFWRKAASTLGEANIAQRERIFEMGDLIDGLTNRR